MVFIDLEVELSYFNPFVTDTFQPPYPRVHYGYNPMNERKPKYHLAVFFLNGS